MIEGFFFLAFGGFLIWSVVLNLRHRGEEKISLLEAAILKTTDEEPLPTTRFDRWLQRFQIVMSGILGPLLLLAGFYSFSKEMGVL